VRGPAAGLSPVPSPCAGRFFDPMGLSRGDAAKYKEYKQKEIKNGRLVRMGIAVARAACSEVLNTRLE
jgi:hypothetical protein